MVKETCENCFYGRKDCAAQIYCAQFNCNFKLHHNCNFWRENEYIDYAKGNYGYVYILSNPDLNGLLKIGMTSKRPEARAKELSGTTGVSSQYVIEYYGSAEDRFIAEKAAHSRLGNYHHQKEFFKVKVEVAIYCVETISCGLKRTYIKPGNELKVLQYARSRDSVPYKQIEREWRERERERKQYLIEQQKMSNWEAKVEDYMRQRTGKEEPLFNYNKLPGNPLKEKNIQPEFTEDYDPKKIVLPSELARVENEAKKARETALKKQREIESLKEELAKEKSKGFFKRLFS